MISYLSTRLPKSSAVNVGIVYLLGALVVAAYIRHENQLDDYDEEYDEEDQRELFVIYIGAAISVVASILLIVGAHYKRRSLIVPWLLYDILVLAGGLINVMVKGMPNANDEMILTFITFGWIIFFWVVVFNFYRKLKLEENQQPSTSSTTAPLTKSKTIKPKKNTKNKVSVQ